MPQVLNYFGHEGVKSEAGGVRRPSRSGQVARLLPGDTRLGAAAPGPE